MIKFRAALQDQIMGYMQTAVGPGSDAQEFIKTFSDHLKDIDLDSNLLPYLVVNVRQSEKDGPSEIGNPYGRYVWTVHIYYIDVIKESKTNSYGVGDARRDHIMARIEKTLEKNWGLDGLQTVDSDNHREYVYSSSIESISFDSGGEEDHMSFISELYFQVLTDRS